MRLIAGLLGALLISSAAHAQNNWTAQRFGNQTYYNGNGGWSGNSQTFGNQTYTNMRGPQGQSRNCTTQYFGNQAYTNCN